MERNLWSSLEKFTSVAECKYRRIYSESINRVNGFDYKVAKGFDDSLEKIIHEHLINARAGELQRD